MGLFVKFSVLQEYGVDRVFLLENANIDSSQRNVVFLVRGEKARHVRIVAGMTLSLFLPPFGLSDWCRLDLFIWVHDGPSLDYAEAFLLYVIWRNVPYIDIYLNNIFTSSFH